jgi:peptidoglycan/LPS O-acetylase OafA/YrhL
MARKESAGWLPQLDGLRGISILMVLCAHVFSPSWKKLQGQYGVTVFFVLSGFLITQLLLREEHENGAISFAAFYIRRIFRLFPLYYLILGVYCVLILAVGLNPDGRPGFVDALPWYLTYLQEIPHLRDRTLSDPNVVPFYQSWSLGIEEKFYLIWPLVAFRLLRNQSARIVLCASAVLLFSASGLVHQGRYIYPYAAISVGCLFALLYDTAGIRDRLAGWVSSWRALPMFLTWPLLHGLVAWSSLPSEVRLLADLAYPLSIAFVILASLRSSWLARALSFTPLSVLGQYSYCIYLIHPLARRAVEQVLHVRTGQGNSLVIFLLMLLFSTIGAGILHYTVESPLREMGRRIARSRYLRTASWTSVYR